MSGENPTERDIQAAFGQRVYEYRDDKGVLYWSFTRAQNIISPPKRLKMQDRMGVHLNRFLVRLRKLSETVQVTKEDDG